MLQIKAVKFYELLSEETNCFTCNIYLGKKKIGNAQNSGHGGNTSVVIEKEFLTDVKAIVKSSNDDFHYKLEEIVDGLFEDWLTTHYDKKEKAKIKKLSVNNIVLKKDNEVYTIKLNNPVEQILKSNIGIEELKSHLIDLKQKGYEIINDNIPNELK